MKKLLLVIPFLLVPLQAFATSMQSEDPCVTIECTTTEYTKEVWHETSGYHFVTKLVKEISWPTSKPKGPRMCLNKQERANAISNMGTNGWSITASGDVFDDKSNYRGVCGGVRKDKPAKKPIITWIPVTERIPWYHRWMTLETFSITECIIIPPDPPDPVPEPSTMLLFGAGMACLAGNLRNKEYNKRRIKP